MHSTGPRPPAPRYIRVRTKFKYRRYFTKRRAGSIPTSPPWFPCLFANDSEAAARESIVSWGRGTIPKVAAALALIAFATGCRDVNTPGSPFRRSQLTAAEKASMREKGINRWGDVPIYRSVWKGDPHHQRAAWEGDPHRHVCLRPDTFGGFPRSFDVAIFLPDGTLEEQTNIDAPGRWEPYRLLQPSHHMVIWFRDPEEDRRYFFKEARPAEEWRENMRELLGVILEIREDDLNTLEATGSGAAEEIAAVKSHLKELREARERIRSQ